MSGVECQALGPGKRSFTPGEKSYNCRTSSSLRPGLSRPGRSSTTLDASVTEPSPVRCSRTVSRTFTPGGQHTCRSTFLRLHPQSCPSHTSQFRSSFRTCSTTTVFLGGALGKDGFGVQTNLYLLEQVTSPF